MSATINTRIKFKRDTTQHWNDARGFIPLQGELIIYNDYKTVVKTIDGTVRNMQVPGIKIGDGLTYVQDLPFVDDELRETIMNHINNPNLHVSDADRLFWNNKINVNDAQEVVNKALIFNRNQGDELWHIQM